MDPLIMKLLSSADFKVGDAGGAGGVAAGPGEAGGAAGGGFGKMLEGAIGKLDGSLGNAATASQQLATGQAQDISQVAMTVQRSMLELQLAAQIRNKAVEAYQDLYRMQI
jgi:flagellar hook-basal body complex protein FliE